LQPPLTSNVRQCESKAEFMPHLPFPAAQCLNLDALSQWERRARFSVGLGCPSFGGQRAGRSCSSRLLASVVTDLNPPLPAAGSWKAFAKFYPRRGALRESLRSHGHRAWPRTRRWSLPARSNPEHQMPKVSVCQLRASWLPSHSLSAVVASRSAHPLAQPGSPNRSVKGTSRKRAAPYVER
jgi:hypothetical protein